LIGGVENSVNKFGSGDYSFLFANLGILSEADILFANLEGPISDKGSDLGKKYSFRMDPKVASVLAVAGFDIVSIANNHADDWGRLAFIDSIERLNEAGIIATGYTKNSSAPDALRIFSKNGISIGYLAFSEFDTTLSRSGNDPRMLSISNPNYEQIISDGARQVDQLIVSYHFGDEYRDKPNSRQKKLARDAIDLGADIIIGHHPHVIESVENYKDGVIAYSLGNFIFDQDFSVETMQGLVFEVILDRDGIKKVNYGITEQNEKFQPELLYWCVDFIDCSLP